MRRIRYISHRHRTPSTNRMLGLLLAFNAGAINAGGLLVLHVYTSHMTGFASQLADSAVLGNMRLVLSALGAIMSFILGAAVCALLVNWARQRRWQSVYALPLLVEAALMAPFGLAGAITLTWSTPFAVPITALLLSFIMGLQNAVGSKPSGGSVRTTHMTGNITDLGMELAKALYWNSYRESPARMVRHNGNRRCSAGSLICAFILGGVAGAIGFTKVGFVCVVPLAASLLALSIPPLLREHRRTRREHVSQS